MITKLLNNDLENKLLELLKDTKWDKLDYMAIDIIGDTIIKDCKYPIVDGKNYSFDGSKLTLIKKA